MGCEIVDFATTPTTTQIGASYFNGTLSKVNQTNHRKIEERLILISDFFSASVRFVDKKSYTETAGCRNLGKREGGPGVNFTNTL